MHTKRELFALVALFGCGCNLFGGGSDDATTPQDAVGASAIGSGIGPITLISPLGGIGCSSIGPTVTLKGLSLGATTALTWSTDRGHNGSAVGTSTWSVDGLALEPGPNVVTLTATDGTNSQTASLVCMRNSTLALAAAPEVRPGTLIAGEPEVISVVAAITSVASLNTASLRVARVQPNGELVTLAPLAPFSLDGQPAGQVAYYASASLLERTNGSIKLAIVADGAAGQPPETVPIGSVSVLPRITSQAVTQALATLSELAATAPQDPANTSDAAMHAYLGRLATDARILRFGYVEGGNSITLLLAGGIPAVIPFGTADTRAASVGSNAAFIASAFSNEFAPHDESNTVAQLLQSTQCNTSYSLNGPLVDGAVTVESLQALTRFGVISLVSHGAVVNSARKGWIAERAAETPFTPPANIKTPVVEPALVGDEILVLRQEATADFADRYARELASGELVLLPSGPGLSGGRIAITPDFIRHLPGRFSESFVYVGACFAGNNGSMAKAFLEKGAKSYVGYNTLVPSEFASKTGSDLFTCLQTAHHPDGSPKTLHECLDPVPTKQVVTPLFIGDKFSAINRTIFPRIFGDGDTTLGGTCCPTANLTGLANGATPRALGGFCPAPPGRPVPSPTCKVVWDQCPPTCDSNVPEGVWAACLKKTIPCNPHQKCE